MVQKQNKKLTKREEQIVHGVIDGFTSQQIADHYEISIHTVRNHRKNIMKKFNLKRATQMAALISKQINQGQIK